MFYLPIYDVHTVQAEIYSRPGIALPANFSVSTVFQEQETEQTYQVTRPSRVGPEFSTTDPLTR